MPLWRFGGRQAPRVSPADIGPGSCLSAAAAGVPPVSAGQRTHQGRALASLTREASFPRVHLPPKAQGSTSAISATVATSQSGWLCPTPAEGSALTQPPGRAGEGTRGHSRLINGSFFSDVFLPSIQFRRAASRTVRTRCPVESNPEGRGKAEVFL